MTDSVLLLPEGEVSYLLQDWDQKLGIENAFGKVTYPAGRLMTNDTAGRVVVPLAENAAIGLSD